MARSALLIAILCYSGIAAFVLKTCVFLTPYRASLWERYSQWIVWFSIALILNLFAGAYASLRRVALKDTGAKLAHLEKQLRGSRSISDELTERILEGK